MKKERIKYTMETMPERLTVPNGKIRWNGTRHWNYIVAFSVGMCIVRRHSRYGWNYFLVHLEKDSSTTDLFGDSFFRFMKINSNPVVENQEGFLKEVVGKEFTFPLSKDNLIYSLEVEGEMLDNDFFSGEDEGEELKNEEV